ncbi:MAG: hypothetical protein AAF802_04180 [Planctomycetota bacterium]
MSGVSINPYQPRVDRGSISHKLLIDGTITEQDYASLLPRRDFESVLLGILFFLLILVTTIVSLAVVASVVKNGWDLFVVPAAAIVLLCTAGSAFLFAHTRPLARARRLLKMWPDLLCHVQGSLSETGLHFFDGQRRYWFSSGRLSKTSVTDEGVRIYLDENPLRFLAISRQMIDGFDLLTANRLKQIWQDSTPKDDSPQIGSWSNVMPKPKGAVGFEGWVSIEQPLRTAEMSQRIKIEVGTTAIVAFITPFTTGWAQYFFFVLFTISVLSLANCVRKYYRGKSVQTWHQYGWINSTHIALLAEGYGEQIPISDIANHFDHDQSITLQSASNRYYFLMREQFQSDDDWSRMLAYCGVEKKNQSS